MSNVSQHRAPIDDFTHEGWRWAITKGTEEGKYTLWRFMEPQGGYQGTFYADECYAEDNEILSLNDIHNLG